LYLIRELHSAWSWLSWIGPPSPDWQTTEWDPDLDAWVERDSALTWKAHGDMAMLAHDGRGQENKHRERIWFSPHCLKAHKIAAA
jgi:hypothetical protein